MLSQVSSAVSPSQFAIITLGEIDALHGCNASELRTYLALAAHADDAGICWPGRRRLAQITGQSKEHVTRSTSALEAAGLIEKTITPHGRITYHLPHHRHGPDPAPPQCPTGHPPVPDPAPQEQTTEQIAGTEERPAEPAPATATVAAPEPVPESLSHSLRHIKTAAPDGIPPAWIDAGKLLRPDLPEAVIRDTAERFLDHSRAKGTVMADWVPAWRNWLRRERAPKATEKPYTPSNPASAPSPYAGWTTGPAPICGAILTPEQAQARFEADMRRYGAVKNPDGTWSRPTAAPVAPMAPAPVAPVVAAVRQHTALSQEAQRRIAALAAAGRTRQEVMKEEDGRG